MFAFGGVRLADLQTETPFYAYDLDAIEREADELRAGFGDARGEAFYAVKANSAGPIVRALASRGCGADVVSGPELMLALECGVPANRIVYSGVAKTDEELAIAIGAGGSSSIRAIQVESVEEIGRVEARAAVAERVVPIAIRVNPGLERGALGTHAHVATGHDEAKFGVALEDLPAALDRVAAAPHLELVGLSAHAGSQLFTTAPYLASARVVIDLARGVRQRFPLEFVDTGGGFGVDYAGSEGARPATFVRETLALMKSSGAGDLALHVEPGRALVARHGVLVARVIQRKVSASTSASANDGKRWVLIDAGMNDLIRPALYQAKHRVVAIEGAPPPAGGPSWRVAGPICESADDFGEHPLPDGGFDKVAILDAGAYGYTMASRYNGRPLPGEVFLRGGRVVSERVRAPLVEWARERSFG